MSQFLVTVKLPRNPEHYPRNKVVGKCPVSGQRCTDTTGEHHTLLWVGTESEAMTAFEKYHITRIEEV
jgi:hypothetical protein